MKRIWQLAIFCSLLVLSVWGAKKIWLKIFPEPKENLPLHLLLVTGGKMITSQYLSPFDWQSREKIVVFLWGDTKAAPADISYIDLSDQDHWQVYLKGQPDSPQELLYTTPQWTFWPDDSTRQTDLIPINQILAVTTNAAGLKEAAKNAGIIKAQAEHQKWPAGSPAETNSADKPSQ